MIVDEHINEEEWGNDKALKRIFISSFASMKKSFTGYIRDEYDFSNIGLKEGSENKAEDEQAYEYEYIKRLEQVRARGVCA